MKVEVLLNFEHGAQIPKLAFTMLRDLSVARQLFLVSLIFLGTDHDRSCSFEFFTFIAHCLYETL